MSDPKIEDLELQEFSGHEKEDYTDLDYHRILTQTQLAVLFRFKLRGEPEDVWFPKDQLRLDEEGAIYFSKWIVETKEEETGITF